MSPQWYALPHYAPMGIISIRTHLCRAGESQRSTHHLKVEAVENVFDTHNHRFTILSQPDISESQVGSTYTLDSGPIFQQTVEYLTNGRTGWLTFCVGLACWGATKHYFNGDYPGVDLMGFTIEGLDLSINSYRTWQETSDFYAYEAATTFVIRGRFPFTRKEPPPPEGPSPPVDGSTVVAKLR
jgi:hypothetical protein